MPNSLSEHAFELKIGRYEANLISGAYNADNDFAQTALEQGADVNVAEPTTGLTALHIAVGTNNLSLVKDLIEKWDAQFYQDRKGRWPSNVAAQCRVSDKLCAYLLEKELAAFTR